jgi:hypothetical protein
VKKTFAIFIGSEQKGLLVAIADILESKYNFSVIIVARDLVVKHYIEKLLPKREKDIILSNINPKINCDKIIEEGCKIEKKYNINLSTLMSEDRALGQGYLFNVENIPDIIRASWTHEKKIFEIISMIRKYETVLKDVDYVIRMWPDKLVTSIIESNGGRSYSLTSIKYGDRLFWSNNNFITSEKYIDRVVKNITLLDYKNIIKKQYQIHADAEKVNLDAKYSILNSTKIFLRILFNDTKNFVRGINKKNSYRYLGWAPSVFINFFNYRYVKSISVLPDDIEKKYRLCFFTLHLEPEVALMSFSPEFSNSMEVITWVSKSLPADTLLVVKEQAHSFGVRSKWYYQQINKIGNVVWANPDIHSWDWIDRSRFVVTITGTIGVEAVYFNKPVISYGIHQIINYLPTVHYVSNFIETKKAVNKVLEGNISDKEYSQSRLCLEKAQLDSSFDLPNYKNSYKGELLEIDMAEIALENLFSEYPETL